MQQITIFLGQPNKKEQSMFPNNINFAIQNEQGLFDALRPYSLQICCGLHLYKCSSFDNKDALHNVIKEINKIKQWANLNINTIKYNEKKYINHFFSNFKENPKYVKHLFNKFKMPCIIVSAGASLDKNINLLKQKKSLIITTPPVLNKLNKINIRVDFVVFISPHKPNKEHFKNITKYPPLIFDSGCNQDVISNYKGEKYISLDSKPVSNYINNILDIGNVLCGMCVSHYAYNLAVKMGCEPIIFVGQDLSFTNNKSHATCTALNENKEGDIVIDGYFGGKVKTDMLMKSYLDIFESMMRESKTKTYNCTEGGVNIKGMENKSLKEVLLKLEEVNVISFLKELQLIKDDSLR
ncbi:unnamed protein product, partial [marine sediment metagenome]